jgi:3-deoxy-D-manno-octulosonate 8-phosphate phosphatase (KDO 8-P phosphatase)
VAKASPAALVAASEVRAFALDVDGVLTDDAVWWGFRGEEWKRFVFADIMGISRASRAGFRFALVSGEDSPLVARYAAKMKIEDVFAGTTNKAAAVSEFAKRRGLQLRQLCFVGNDVNDLEALALCGLSAAPADAHPAVRAQAHLVTDRGGGHGAVREVIDLVMSQQMTEEPQK